MLFCDHDKKSSSYPTKGQSRKVTGIITRTGNHFSHKLPELIYRRSETTHESDPSTNEINLKI